MSGRFSEAAALIERGVRERAFPGAVIEAGSTSGVLWRFATGSLTYADGSPGVGDDTVYDLASLTKVIATTSIAMRAVDAGRLALSDPVSQHIDAWRGPDRTHVTIRDLLEHCAGLTGWLPLYRDHATATEVAHTVGTLPLEYAPWTQSIYSDLGFMLLGFVLAHAMDEPLDAQLVRAIGSHTIAFTPPAAWRSRTAPTEDDPWRGRLLIGEVHDENAWALGGVAGHAGLFGTAPAVGDFARLVLRTFTRDTLLARRETLRRFVTRSTVPGSSRALGWDTMLPTSSCGTLMSAAAIGHTGFTGTSLWIDPQADVYIALLTNRVHPTRENDRLKRLRPLVHDAVMRAIRGV